MLFYFLFFTRFKRTLKRQANRSSPSYLSPVSPKGERQFVRLMKELIGKELHNSSEDSQDTDKPVLPTLEGTEKVKSTFRLKVNDE